MLTVSEILSKNDIPFTESGGDYLISCLNPEHEDRHPSMRIDQITGIFNCFSCRYRGNIFSVFGEAPNQLQMQRERLKQTINRKRSESIGLTVPKDAIPYTGNWRGISPATYSQFEAFTHHDKHFVGRIVFPLRAFSGRIVAFIGRHTADESPKYLNYPSKVRLPLYPRVRPLYGHVILVEGIYDVLNLYEHGIDNACCIFGVNNITEEKLSMLAMRGTDCIDILLDPDKAGQAGAAQIEALCKKVNLNSRKITLKDNQDPGSLTKEQVTKLRKKLYGKYSDN